MITGTQVAIVGGVGAAAYLGYDYFRNRNNPETGGRTIVGNAASSIVQLVSPGEVSAVKTGYPQGARSMAGEPWIDAPNSSYRDMFAFSDMCTAILCNNVGSGGAVAAVLASVETHRGSDLANNCYNCSAFNIHWTSGVGYPSARVGNDLVISFRTGANSDVEGFRRCIEHFKGYMERRCPDGLVAIRAGDLDAFQIAMSRIGYASLYTNSVQNGRITASIFKARYRRLLQAGLISNGIAARNGVT